MSQNFKNLPAENSSFRLASVIKSHWVMIMKRGIKELLVAVLLGGVIPFAAFRITEVWVKKHHTPEETPPVTQQTEATQTPQSSQQMIPVLKGDGTVQNMDLEEYLTGVVLAEMPSEFESEALKAQAVVARTYALKRTTTGNKHPENAVCTDPACCQAYREQEEFLEAGNSEEQLQKVRRAVQQTKGQVLTYNGNLIEATYYSCSGGRTEDAQAVWGAEIPYLQSVESPGEENASHYIDTVQFSTTEFCRLLDRELPENPETWIGTVTYTAGGGVDRIVIADQEYQGTQLRQLLSLRSTAFVITAAGDTVTITTKGYGHRVGMSQYGAEAMALTGNDYAHILAHYYPGTLLQQWQNN